MRILALIVLFFIFTSPAHAAVAYKSGSFDASGGSTSDCTVNAPAGLATGDLMVGYAFVRSALTFTNPTGWTQLFNSTASGGVLITWKIATAADVSASTFTFAFTGGTDSVNSCSVQVWSGTDQTSPIDQFQAGVNGSGTGGTGTTPTLTGITPTKANTTAVIFAHGLNTTSIMTASGYQIATDNPTWSEHLDSGGTIGTRRISMAMADASRPQTTAYGTTQLTWSGAQTQYGLATFNIVAPTESTFAPWLFQIF